MDPVASSSSASSSAAQPQPPASSLPAYLDDLHPSASSPTYSHQSISIFSSSPNSSSDIDENEDSDDDDDDDEEARLAQQEWDEGVQQLQTALQLVFMPYLGKYFGRRYAYTLWNRYLRLGPTWAFWVDTIFPHWAVSLFGIAV
ncbi:hypothetical protein OC861_004852 [Tilletia horrida]|nr:hypothetical protein OC861_004852 [Tilletia horrida]